MPLKLWFWLGILWYTWKVIYDQYYLFQMCSDLKVPCSSSTLSKCKKARNLILAENPSTAKLGRNSQEIISLRWWEGTYIYMLSHYFFFFFHLIEESNTVKPPCWISDLCSQQKHKALNGKELWKMWEYSDKKIEEIKLRAGKYEASFFDV